MSESRLGRAMGNAQGGDGSERPQHTMPQLLEKMLPEIRRALPRHLDADRMLRLSLTALRMSPQLAACDPKSLLAAVVQASQLGLEIGVGGQAYLIPYGKEAQFVPGWQGLVDLVARAGRAAVWTGAVYDGDSFDFEMGDKPYVRHKPGHQFNEDPDALLYVYSVGRIRDSEYPIIDVWSNAKVRSHFNRFNKVGQRHYAHKNWEMYARKMPLLQVVKYLPKSPQLLTAMALDDTAARGLAQGLTIEGAASSETYTPPDEDDGDTGGDERSGRGRGRQFETTAKTDTTVDADDLLARMQQRSDIDVLDADATLIAKLPEGDQQRVRNVYTELRDKLAGA